MRRSISLMMGIVIPLLLVGVVAAQGTAALRYTFAGGGFADSGSSGSLAVNSSVGQVLGGKASGGAVILDVGFLVGAEDSPKVYLPVIRR